MSRRIVLRLCLITALSLAWLPSSFATVATATLDWSQLRIDLLDIPGYPSAGWSFDTQSTDVSSNALTVADSSDSHTHTAFNWVSPANVESVTPGAQGSAAATDQALRATAWAMPLAAPDLYPYQPNTANAQASRSATIVLDAPGALVFSVPYSIAVSGPPYDYDDYATAHVGGSVSYQPLVGYAYQTASRSLTWIPVSCRNHLSPAR